jgi:hypothetical protein
MAMVPSFMMHTGQYMRWVLFLLCVGLAGCSADSSHGPSPVTPTPFTGVPATVPAGSEPTVGPSTVPIEAGRWVPAGSTSYPGWGHTVTVLANGKVLVAGGAFATSRADGGVLAFCELYDPSTGQWAVTGDLITARGDNSATLLPNGKVLVAGGTTSGGPQLASAELFDPATGHWSQTGAMSHRRTSHMATLLPDGRVLVAGGIEDVNQPDALASAELYNPATGKWTPTGSMSTARVFGAATLLVNGDVLVVGGITGLLAINGEFTSAEVYNPHSGKWSTTGSLAEARSQFTATTLSNGRVLAAGGKHGDVLGSAELYDPKSGTWASAGVMRSPRAEQSAILLANGVVLEAGGFSVILGPGLTSAELYDPNTNSWTATTSMTTGRAAPGSGLLPDGSVLLVGGFSGPIFTPIQSAELYIPRPGP